MRTITIMAFGIAVMLAILVIGTWATATTRLQAGPSVNPFEMMTAQKDLPVPQYAEPF